MISRSLTFISLVTICSLTICADNPLKQGFIADELSPQEKNIIEEACTNVMPLLNKSSTFPKEKDCSLALETVNSITLNNGTQKARIEHNNPTTPSAVWSQELSCSDVLRIIFQQMIPAIRQNYQPKDDYAKLKDKYKSLEYISQSDSAKSQQEIAGLKNNAVTNSETNRRLHELLTKERQEHREELANIQIKNGQKMVGAFLLGAGIATGICTLAYVYYLKSNNPSQS